MNKKVSTLLVTAMILGGSLLTSSAFAKGKLVGAKVDADGFKSGETYFLINEGSIAVGFSEMDPVTKKVKALSIAAGNMSDDMEVADNYLWTVTESPRVATETGDADDKVYKFTNKETGEQLLFDTAGNLILDYSAVTTADKERSIFAWDGWKPYGVVYNGSADRTLYAANSSSPTNKLYVAGAGAEFELNATSTQKFSLYKVADQDVNAGDLNKLYNSIGFNFALEDEKIKNIFDQEGVRIKAFEVTGSGIKFNENGIAGSGDYEFPKGTYFVTETPNEVLSSTASTQDKLNYLLKCTFIAVSSSNNVSQDEDKQATGEGFTLTTVKGEDLVTYRKTTGADANKLPKNDEISVYNACFEVGLKPTDGKYSLTLPQFRYQAAAGDETQTIKTDLQLVLSDDRYGATEYLCTYPSTTVSHIFTFVEANAVNPITEFLNADGQAAIYNIQFVSGEDDDKDEIDKYLFAPAYYSQLYAKGEALTDTNMPEFQFIITNVNGNEVTFTNRANNNVKFTAKFFAEGDGSYILADDNAKNFTIFNINEDGDVVAGATKPLNETVVKLTVPESTDKFNGTWDVEDGSEVTILFARDDDPTSNKLYPQIKVNTKRTSFTFTAPTNEVYDGAHWQLVKSDKPSYKTRMYAYRVGEGDKATVSFKNATDTTAFYTYKFQLVEDGDVVEQYLNITGTDLDINETSEASADAFVIKDNVDGSVAILKDYDSNQYIAFAKHTDTKNDLDDYLTDKSAVPVFASFTQASEAAYIKTYLKAEAPEISWETEGHVTLQSERGNFISLDENNDAIVVTEAEEVYYLNKTDEDAIIPSYFITRGTADGSTAESSRLYMFNPTDSVDYYVGAGKYDKDYQWREETTKVIFKAGQLNATADTLTTNIKGKATKVAMKADNKGTEGGLNRFKFQIVETEDGDGLYYIRQIGATTGGHGDLAGNYLASNNEQLTWSKRAQAMKFALSETSAPTANESVSASEVKVIAVDGAINIKNAAGKNVVVSTILGQIVANEVLTSDNATISVPAGIAIVSVDGEEAVKVSVR